MTFREYALTVRPRLLHPSWEDKFDVTIGGIISLCVIGYFLSFPLNSQGNQDNPWFLLLLVGIIPLTLFLSYCNKKANGELD